MDYDFEAPTYVNFAEAMDDDEAEVSRYFDVEHEESFSRSRGSPAVMLPGGTRDVKPSNRKSSVAADSSSSKKKMSHPTSETRVTGSSSAQRRRNCDTVTPVKMMTPPSVKRLSRVKTPKLTPVKMVAALNSLKLTSATMNSLASSSSKRCRDIVDEVSAPSPNKRSRINAMDNTPLPSVQLKVSPSEQHVLENQVKRRKWVRSESIVSIMDGIEIAIPVEKQHAMETRADKAARHPPIQLRSRSITKSTTEKHPLTFNNLSQHRKRPSLPSDIKSANLSVPTSKGTNPPSERFISLAEATRQFHCRTPLRFRGRPRNSPGNRGKGPVFALKATIPQSPALRVKHRNRPNTAISRDEQEEMELMEIRKKKIKPLPLREHILKPLNHITKVEKKPPTLPAPFKITEVKKKEPVVEPEPMKFTARPVPKKIFEGPIGICEKKPLPLTEPKSPAFLAAALKRSKGASKQPTPLKAIQKFMMKVIENDNGLQIVKDKPIGHLGVPFMPQSVKTNTEVKPFSFEERDKEWMKRREEKLKGLEEQMSQKTEFHAKPAPSFRMRSVSPAVRSRTPRSLCKKTISHQNTPDTRPAAVPPFKARVPTVLSKKPFEPIRPNRQLPLPDVTLASEIRAKERELFEEQQMKRELELESLKQQVKAEKEKQEKEEIALLRKQAVHKSNPVPTVKPFQPQPSDKLLTNPSTPFCLKRSLRKVSYN